MPIPADEPFQDAVPPDYRPERRIADRSDLRDMLRTAWPLVVINLAITGMQFVDALLLAPLGQEALAAIFPAFIIFLAPVIFGHGLLSVINTMVAQYTGAGRPQECGRFTMQGILFAIVFGLVLLPQWYWAPAYFRLLGHEHGVQLLEVEYFRWSLFTAMPSLLVLALSNFFTGLMRPWILVSASVLATALNVLLAWLLIYGHWGLPKMGVGGAALGTALASWGQAAFLMIFFWGREMRRRYDTWNWKLNPAALRQLFVIGTPAGGMPLFDLLTWGVFITWMIGFFGTPQLAANTIVVRYIHLLFMPALGVGAVLTAMVGQAIGQSRHERARRRAFLAYAVIAAYMVTVGLIFVGFRYSLMRVFTKDPVVIAAGGSIFICKTNRQIYS